MLNVKESKWTHEKTGKISVQNNKREKENKKEPEERDEIITIKSRGRKSKHEQEKTGWMIVTKGKKSIKEHRKIDLFIEMRRADSRSYGNQTCDKHFWKQKQK